MPIVGHSALNSLGVLLIPVLRGESDPELSPGIDKFGLANTVARFRSLQGWQGREKELTPNVGSAKASGSAESCVYFTPSWGLAGGM